MTRKVTFLHSGDIHLGAPIRGLRALDESWNQRLRGAIAESYDRLIRTAIARKVDFVIFAGDIFDTSRASYGDYMHFFSGLQKLDEAKIPVYLIAGNHDPFTTWAKDLELLPPSAHMLGIDGPTFELFERDGEPLVLLGGRGFFNQSWPEDKDIAEGITRQAAELALGERYPRASEAPFSVGIIHTGLDFDKNKAPVSEEDLLARGIDYWACGHLHKHLERPDSRNPRIVFPGCIQGRSIKETGPRGCYIVSLEEGAPPSLEMVPTASVVMEKITVDGSLCSTLNDITRSILAESFNVNSRTHCEDMVVQVTLTGTTDLYDFLADPDTLERLRCEMNGAYPSFYYDRLVSRMEPKKPPGEVLAVEEGSAAAFPALVHAMAADQKARPEEMINFVQSELVKRGIPVPLSLSRRIDEFEDAAQDLVLHLLREDSQ